MKYLELFENYNSSRAYLYHAIKEEFAKIALETDVLECYGFQRTWPGGKRLKDDNQPAYNNSWWMRGISLTRDVNFAKNWNNIVFVFDQTKLSTKWKIVPYNWGYSIGGSYRQNELAKREKEEFLITSIIKEPLSNSDFMKKRNESGGTIQPLSKYIVGFYLLEKNIKYIDNLQFFESHPLYMGILK
jgi:hypothetical protein